MQKHFWLLKDVKRKLCSHWNIKNIWFLQISGLLDTRHSIFFHHHLILLILSKNYYHIKKCNEKVASMIHIFLSASIFTQKNFLFYQNVNENKRIFFLPTSLIFFSSCCWKDLINYRDFFFSFISLRHKQRE